MAGTLRYELLPAGLGHAVAEENQAVDLAAQQHLAIAFLMQVMVPSPENDGMLRFSPPLRYLNDQRVKDWKCQVR
ncbi:MAG: hypothetical protein U1F35_09990 [Steroidobacteraceae bacterium]